MFRNKSVVIAAFVLATVATTAQAQASRNFHALSGPDAAAFVVPSDAVLINQFDLPAYGLVYERYQQFFGSANAAVLGGQITVLKNAQGVAQYVVGAVYQGITAANRVNLAAAQARQRSAQDIGPAGVRLVSLRINPDSGRYFYEVDTQRGDSRWIHWIDAGNGAIVKKYDALTNGDGFGVQYDQDNTDVKDLAGLTTFSGGQHRLISANGRQETHDQGSTNRPFLGPVATDSDDNWVLLGNVSPAQQALVDAHYYAWVTDTYYLGIHAFDWVGQAIANGANTKMEIHAHFFKNYNNAYWSGAYIALGDGDQSSFEELTSLDVVGHELTHGVTEFTSDLIYQGESGALNEAFSDMMGSSMEFYAESQGLEPANTLSPDWLIGEDFDLRGGAAPGFRNMMDPTEDGDPAHYADRYTGTGDNGGVHINSGIANHWYYLLVNGGQNADPARASGTNVAGVGLADAETIAFLGFTSLPENATFCDARSATVAVGGAHAANVGDAWDEVGVDSGLCGGGGDPGTPPGAATNPSPANGATSVDVNANLAWTAGADATSHDVYFGTDSTPDAGEFQGNQAGTSFDPGTLANNTTYYWRIDEVNGFGTTAGTVWSFTTEGVSADPTTMHVASIATSTVNIARGNKAGQAQVTIVDDQGNPVAGAEVTVTFTGDYNETVAASTNNSGVANLTTSSTARGGVSFQVCVDNVTHGTLTYAPGDNAATCASL